MNDSQDTASFLARQSDASLPHTLAKDLDLRAPVPQRGRRPQEGEGDPPTTEQRLAFYALYKQVSTPLPLPSAIAPLPP